MQGAELAALFERDIDILTRIVSMPKIVIVAVNGQTSGLGNHLAICADLCIIKKSAKFHFTGAAKALPSLLLGTLLLPMTVGLKRAKSIYLRGGQYSGGQAVADGFCNYAVDNADWDTELEEDRCRIRGTQSADDGAQQYSAQSRSAANARRGQAVRSAGAETAVQRNIDPPRAAWTTRQRNPDRLLKGTAADETRDLLLLGDHACRPDQRLWEQGSSLDYPSRTIRIIVPFAPGGGSDFIARPVGNALSERWGKPVIVENKAGAGSTLGASYALKSPADGYTLLLISSSYAVNPAVYSNMTFKFA